MRVLAVLQFFVWLFALTFVALGMLGLVGIVLGLDLLMWLELGAAAGVIHLAVIAAMIVRRGARLTPRAIGL